MPTPGLGTQTPRRSSTRPGINPFTPPIPAPTTDVSNLKACVEALKASMESLTGQRGDAVNRAVTFRDLANYNLLSPAAAASPDGSPGSANDKITLSGDVSGSGNTAISTVLATVNSHVGTHQGITVNAKGLVTQAVDEDYATHADMAAGDALRVLKAGDTMTGALVLPADPTTSQQAATKHYVDTTTAAGDAAGDALRVLKAGDTMTGALVLPGDPTTSQQAATKHYVDITTVVPANPTAVGGDAAINGSASTFMRSDAAPAIQKTSSTNFGLAKVDGTTLIATAGTIGLAPFVDVTISNSLGIGTSAPAGSLDVRCNTNPQYISVHINSHGAGGDNCMLVACGLPGSDVGSALIGFYDGAILHYQGGIFRNGDGAVIYSSASDERLKTNIADSEIGLDALMRVRVRDYKSLDGAPQHGFVAQELAEVYPLAVHQGDELPWGVDYGRVTPLLVRAIQQQQAQIDELKARLNALEVK